MTSNYSSFRFANPASGAFWRVGLSFAAGAFLALLLGLVSLEASAQGAPPAEGRDYQRIDPPQPLEAPGKVEVVFFFGYWCPHCNEFNPGFTDWTKKQGPEVTVRRVPIAFNDSQVPLQRLYYVLDSLGKEDELRSKVFAAIHVDQNPLNTAELQAQFAQKNGIDSKKFLDLYNSFSIQSKVRRASQMSQAYGVDGIPFVAVDGKYRLGQQANVYPVLDSLVASERKTLGPGKS